jgi:type II secretory pathway predicted ATPase ExeA
MDYEAFFKLKERPFKSPLEAKFYYRVPAFERMGQILANSPRPELLVLKGPAGCGKSSLLRRLPWALKEKIVVAPILLTGHQLGDFLRDALIGFGLGFKCSPQIPEESLLGFFQNAVGNFLAHDYGLALAADEAQALSEENLSDLLHLLSLEPGWRGQTTLLAATRANSPWPGPKFPKAQILGLAPLNLNQTMEYVRLRMKAAGAKKDFFAPEALAALHELSQGSPAAINALAERALLTAWAASKKEITPAFMAQAKASLDSPFKINPQNAQKAAGFRPERQKIRSRPVRLTLAVFMAVVFSLGFIFWPKSPPAPEPVAKAKAVAPLAAPINPPTATPAAEPLPPGQTPSLGLPTPPPVLLNLPHNANALVVDQSLGQARLWRGQLRKSGLKAELTAPELSEPGLYLVGRPKSRLSLVFQYPPGQEVPKEVGEKLWRQVETLLPQDILPLIVADSDLLVQPVTPETLGILKEKLNAWTAAQEVKFTDNLALLYADPFVFYEPGQKPQTIARENFQVALASEARTSGDVKLAISEPLIALDPRNHRRAWAIFSLRYDSRLRHDIGLRTLIFEKNLLGDDWLIKAELWIRENSLKS